MKMFGINCSFPTPKYLQKIPNHAPLEISMPMQNAYVVETARNDGTKVSIYRQVETVRDCFDKPLFVTEYNQRGFISQFINLFSGDKQIPNGTVILADSNLTFKFKGFANNPTEVFQVVNGKNEYFVKKCSPEQLKRVVNYIRKGIIV